jgi:hypothetical protein
MHTALACLTAFCLAIGISALAAAESWPEVTTIESEP